MESTDQRFANRCLPLLIANQLGWFILNSHTVRIAWTGSPSISAMTVEVLAGDGPVPARSHFGHGIVTWSIPFLFRTSPGYNLHVRGPSNMPKDGVAPLEGIIETDWCMATFTMNWRLTRATRALYFYTGEPIAMIVPQARYEIEQFRPCLSDIDAEPSAAEGFRAWRDSRSAFLDELTLPVSDAVRQGWQRDYVRGIAPSGQRFAAHQTKLDVRPFVSDVGNGTNIPDDTRS
jgi:hypothetical protein